MIKRTDLYNKIAVIFFALAAIPTSVFSQSSQFSINESPLPAPTGHVNDYAGVIDEAAKQELERRLRDFQAASGIELAVAVVNTTGDRPIFDYSLAVARGWGIGSKADDNPGALLFVAIDDRKYFTQISRDLEDELPDGVAGSLQRQFLVPEFRKGNYAKGISDTMEAYIAAIEYKQTGEGAPPAGRVAPAAEPGVFSDTWDSLESLCCWIILIGFLILIIWSNSGGGKSKDDNDRWGGGGFGGGGSSALPWIIGSILASSAGRSSSGSSWGGGGGSSWGGFGGGGDFGGGGAGGDW